MTEPRLMGCEEALRLLAEFLDGELAGDAQQEVAGHLERCRTCYSRAEFERRLQQQLSRLGRTPVTPELEGRVRGLIRQFTDAPERS